MVKLDRKIFVRTLTLFKILENFMTLNIGIIACLFVAGVDRKLRQRVKCPLQYSNRHRHNSNYSLLLYTIFKHILILLHSTIFQ